MLLSGLVFLLAGCAGRLPSVYGARGVSPAPDVPWVAPAKARRVPPPPEAAALPESLLAASAHWTLADLVDIALRQSSETQIAWMQARSAAAAYGSKRGTYLPNVTLSADLTRQKSFFVPTGASNVHETGSGSADLSWLLFNFGGRRASVEETRQALIAADWTHNSVIQNVVLEVEQAYYEYVTARALLAAEESTLVEVRVSLAAADERHRTGLATIADVLQARTSVSQTEFAVQSLKGQIAVTRGALATSMGLPANTSFDIEPPPLELPVQRVSENVEEYLDRAREQRPDLAAARAQVVEADAHTRKVWADGLPSFSALGNLGRIYVEGSNRPHDTYSVSLQMTFPIFTGFSHHYDLLQARADAGTARARLQNLNQSVVLEVWTSYYNFKTAEEQLRAANDLLESATASREVAFGRYKAGVGSILDLLTAQASLEAARASQVQARANWFVSLAYLAHDTGELGPAEVRKEGTP